MPTELVTAECENCGKEAKIVKERSVYYFHCPDCSGTMVREDVDER